jgi:polyphosphate kinase 2 (PPK2 family)
MPKPRAANFHKFIKPYVVVSGKMFRLKDPDPKDTHHLNSEDKPEAKRLVVEEGVKMLADLQEVLYAQSHWGLLLIFQAMDAAGKDGTIKHVMSGVNPQGVDVFSFESPSSEEMSHDFLWRSNRCLPPRGKIGIFNRSYYEEVLSRAGIRACSRNSAFQTNYAGSTSGGIGSKISKLSNACQDAYEKTIRNTASEYAPWVV